MPMSRIQLLLGKIAEECSEIAQRALKAQQFGLDEIQPGQELNNWERLSEEINDLNTILLMIEEDLNKNFSFATLSAIQLRIKKVEKYLKLSQSLGIIE